MKKKVLSSRDNIWGLNNLCSHFFKKNFFVEKLFLSLGSLYEKLLSLKLYYKFDLKNNLL